MSINTGERKTVECYVFDMPSKRLGKTVYVFLVRCHELNSLLKILNKAHDLSVNMKVFFYFYDNGKLFLKVINFVLLELIV